MSRKVERRNNLTWPKKYNFDTKDKTANIFVLSQNLWHKYIQQEIYL